MTLYGADLDLLQDTALEAGAIAMRYFRKDPKVWWKEGNSPVSEADFAVDDFLKARLLSARPEFGWVSEEMQDRTETVCESFFVVDPIDGTRAYLRGEDTWCVSIALVTAGRPVIGVIVAPSLEETFTATADGAAFMNGRPCHASRPETEAELKLAMPDSMRKMLQNDGAEPFHAMKSVPSLAYRVALVADGRLDGTLVRPNANDWDIAAADLLLERAGGRLTDGRGRRLLYTSAPRRHGLLMAASDGASARVGRLASAVADRM